MGKLDWGSLIADIVTQGDVGEHRQPNYSRGVRQRLHKLSIELKWQEKYNVLIGSRELVEVGCIRGPTLNSPSMFGPDHSSCTTGGLFRAIVPVQVLPCGPRCEVVLLVTMATSHPRLSACRE